jgi:hypothetical protein
LNWTAVNNMKTTTPGDRSMMLRVVLVGGVALLGLTIPSQRGCEVWFASAQSWASAVLADWDNWTPHGRGSSEFSGERVPRVCERCRLARERLTGQKCTPAATAVTRSVASVGLATNPAAAAGFDVLPADVFARSAPAFEPTQVPEALSRDADYAVASSAEGWPETPVAPEPAAAHIALPNAVRFVHVLSSKVEKALIGGLARGLEQAAVRLTPVRTAGPQAADPESTLIADEAFMCGLPDDEVIDDSAATVQSTPVATAQETVSVQVADADFDPGCAFETESPTTEAPAPGPAALAAELPWPIFAPSSAVEQPETRVSTAGQTAPAAADSALGAVKPADASRTRVTTIDDRPQTQTALESPTASSGLKQAVELTRNAAFAWVRVLTGPALVNVTAR